MSRALGGVVLILGAAILLLRPTAGVSQQSSAKFEPPDVQSASNIPYPPNTTTTGLVSFLLDVNETGRVQKIHVMRDTAPLTAAAQSSLVQTWSFKPAQSDGRTIASQLPLSVAFNPYNPGGSEIAGFAIPDTASSATPASSPFVPAKITTATYALYPPDTLAQGTVVLSLTLSRAGQVQKVRLVKDVAALSAAAMDAVKSWKYEPAKWNGQAVSSKLIVAFVFQRNVS
jgi:TonB family protein